MRCLSCNEILTDKEATRRGAYTNEFMDLCDHCLSSISGVDTYTRPEFEDNECENQED